MALWQFHLLTRDLTDQDSNGWPSGSFVPSTVELEEQTASKLRRDARRLIHSQIKKPAAIIKVERLGKRENKVLDWFNDEPEELIYQLSEEQQRTLEVCKEEIWTKALGGEPFLPRRNSALIDSVTDIKYLSSGVACFYDLCGGGYPPETRILSHQQAQKHVAALQRFYSNISAEELQILCFHGELLRPEEMNVIRAYGKPVRN